MSYDTLYHKEAPEGLWDCSILQTRIYHTQQTIQFQDKQPKDKRTNHVNGLTYAGQGCSESYLSDTKQALKARINQQANKHGPKFCRLPSY